MMNWNLVEQIGHPLTVWTKEGNSLEYRILLTVDEFGVVVTTYDERKAVFVPWERIKYIDIYSREALVACDEPSPNKSKR